MKKSAILTLILCLSATAAFAQNALLQNGAVQIDSLGLLPDSIYDQLSPFQMIMVGEMHGSNEPAAFVGGLADLFTRHGERISVGLEIQPELMQSFLSQGSDSSVFQSTFFANPPYLDGRESLAWAKLLLRLKQMPGVEIFFFDPDKNECLGCDRDSAMYAKIKKKFLEHPDRKLITLSGNYHNSRHEGVMYDYLKADSKLLPICRICTLNHCYKSGSCRANFGHGLELRPLENPESIFSTGLPYNKYFYLVSPNSTYPYTGLFFTKIITPAIMVSDAH